MNNADVYIEDGRIVGSFTFVVDGREMALDFTMAVADAERAATDEVSPTFNVHEL